MFLFERKLLLLNQQQQQQQQVPPRPKSANAISEMNQKFLPIHKPANIKMRKSLFMRTRNS